MKRILLRRRSPALVVSMIALFVSLSGVSYGVATGFIDSREIKNNAIRGVDIRNSTVTGKDIKETTLSTVPSATTAKAISTSKQIPLMTLAEGSPRATLLSHGPLTVLAECVSTPYSWGSGTRLRVLLQTTEDNSAGGDHQPQSDIDSSSEPQEIAWAEDLDTGGIRATGVEEVFGLAPSGKSFTGQLGLVADRNDSVRSCMLHGHLALQG